MVGSDNLRSLIIGRMKDGQLCRPFSFYPSLLIQKTETTKYFRLNFVLNIQNTTRIPIIIIIFASPIGGSMSKTENSQLVKERRISLSISALKCLENKEEKEEWVETMCYPGVLY